MGRNQTTFPRLSRISGPAWSTPFSGETNRYPGAVPCARVNTVTGVGRRSGRDTKCWVAKLRATLDAQPDPSRPSPSASAAMQPETQTAFTGLPIAGRFELRAELFRHGPVGMGCLRPRERLLEERDRLLGAAERPQRSPDPEAGLLPDARVARVLLARLERSAVVHERLVVEGVLPLPVAEVHQERSPPVGRPRIAVGQL